ncbi:hypothetical protein C0992_009086 [Termitomyces sp. T32_za158]|nr:hypothetical protein C0992_009086 [Termitomyces sp. T32_za158]
MLGDNPMQSEFACHIGLCGRQFCRICHVEGEVEGGNEMDGGRRNDIEGEAHQDSDASNASNVSQSRTIKKSGRKSESMAEMIERVQNFVTIGHLRTKEETKTVLQSHLAEARRIGGNAAFKRSKTDTGVKDTYQAFFLNRLFDISTKRGKRREEKEALMHDIESSFPLEITSPVWRIRDFDPHSDTPVEILHVILLGFVKYFWRDAIHRLKPEQKEVLILRLSSFDTSGLNISPLSGPTLVTYAGSLTGRDFRVIAQVAPFVLYDLLEKDLLDCWNALGVLIPLVWQPKIDNVNEYIAFMKSAIDAFLDCTCRVTPRWFNKPKFHIILHLPDHVRRFGPAILFATEGFESFNAIIRSASIHSNRHAPSQDIAQQMAKGSRIRHLLSGGKFLMNRLKEPAEGRDNSLMHWMERSNDMQSLKWNSIGPEPLKLLEIHNFGRKILKLEQNNECEILTGQSCSL